MCVIGIPLQYIIKHQSHYGRNHSDSDSTVIFASYATGFVMSPRAYCTVTIIMITVPTVTAHSVVGTWCHEDSNL